MASIKPWPYRAVTSPAKYRQISIPDLLHCSYSSFSGQHFLLQSLSLGLSWLTEIHRRMAMTRPMRRVILGMLLSPTSPCLKHFPVLSAFLPSCHSHHSHHSPKTRGKVSSVSTPWATKDATGLILQSSRLEMIGVHPALLSIMLYPAACHSQASLDSWCSSWSVCFARVFSWTERRTCRLHRATINSKTFEHSSPAIDSPWFAVTFLISCSTWTFAELYCFCFNFSSLVIVASVHAKLVSCRLPRSKHRHTA